MRIYSLNLNTKTTDQMIAHLKRGLSTDTFDQLRQRLNISDNALSKAGRQKTFQKVGLAFRFLI
jgi:hypothetical protein